MGRGQPQGKRKGDDVVFPLKVSLEELYNGLTKKLRLTKNVICSGCNGYTLLCLPFSFLSHLCSRPFIH